MRLNFGNSLLLLSALISTMCFTTFVNAEQIGEKVVYFDPDGKNASVYYSVRTDSPELNWRFSDVSDMAEYTDSLIYRFPNGGQKDEIDGEPNWRTMGGDLSHIRLTDLSKQPYHTYMSSNEGSFRWKNWDDQTKLAGSHYGDWIGGQFGQYAAAFILPSNMEFVDYSANVKGDWVVSGNAISFFAVNANNIVFDLSYRRKLTGLFEETNSKLKGLPAEIVLDSEGIRITVVGKVLFNSGSADISSEGSSILSKIATALSSRSGVRVVIAGHTDNDPISTEEFPSNWYLSSARSLSVLTQLIDFGVEEGAMETRAYGEHQPKVANSSASNMALNRRIEILVMDEG